MPDAPHKQAVGSTPRKLGLRFAATLAVGAVATLLMGFGSGAIAIVCGLIAQPAFALAARGVDIGDRRILQRDALALLALWALALAVAGMLTAWPLSTLLQDGGLGAAVGLSAMAGVCLIVVWRTWPLWHGI
ncbi:MAG: hypothetical protein ABJA62_11315, partial [Luteimonas sp.]